MSKQLHKLDSENQVGVTIGGKEGWRPALSYPYFVTKGLPFWKRPFEKYWRPECNCGRIFDTLEDYNAHYVYKSIYGDSAS